MTSHVTVNVTGLLLVQKANDLILHHVSVYVMQPLLAHQGKRSVNLLVSVNAIQHSNAVRAKSLIQNPASAFVRL